MDKQQLAQEILKKYNIQGYIPPSKQSVDLNSRFAEIDALASGQTTEKPKRTFTEKVADFTGGKEIAQGLGQAIARPKVVKQIEETQASQIKIQSDLLERTKQNKAQGIDTSRLENALAMITEDIGATGEGAEGLLNPNELTTKQVLGDALQLGTLAGAGTIFKGASALAGKTGMAGIGVGSGALKGATTGAITGAGTGGLLGASQGLQEDKDLEGVLKDAGTGALLGGATGGVLGAVTGGVSGGIKQAKITKQNKYLDAITPNTKDLTPTEYEDLLNRGKITPKTATQPSKYILSLEEKAIAQKYKSIFTNDPVKNTENIINEIAKKDKEVGTFLKKNNGIFNTGELKNSLTKKLADIDDLTIDEARLSKLKQNTVNNFLKSLKKNDMETLWKSRKEFDRTIEKAFSGSPSLQNTIKKEFRNAIQDFIAERTPDGVYKTSMKEMSQLFNLKDITNQKAIKEKGRNAIQLWIKKHPTRTKIIGGVAGTGILTGIGASLLKD
ncbi:hypothetical protein K9M47_03060 [Candidatus Gracilibacteria bacterium]|nr:hypothetical protein [Candidatus Gracilibacteria bacterium]